MFPDMLSPADFRDVVSGRRPDALASVLRGLFRLAETPCRMAVDWRNRRYDRGTAMVHQAGVPVVSVGNLTLGGTGKTPLVKWLGRWFTERGRRVVIVSRGYRAMADGLNDEALELQQSLPNVPHVQNPDRVAAVRAAIDIHGCDLILLDDGFQHRRLARDVDIVLLDALEPFGFDHIFPRGTLREPVAGLRRANVVCLSRADASCSGGRAEIRCRVAAIAPQAAWCELIHTPTGLIDSAGMVLGLGVLRGHRVAAFCGIGNPFAFRRTLASSQCEIAAWREFPDHHHYVDRDLSELGELVASSGADFVVCTQKDLVKLRGARISDRPIWAVTIEIEFLSGQNDLENALRSLSPHLAPGQ
jgi:tetraacyldisaccharide 4'-kinase